MSFFVFRNILRSKRETKCSWFNCEDSKHYSLEERTDVLLLKHGKRSDRRSFGDGSENSANLDCKIPRNKHIQVCGPIP
jgi:hypothetical protein